MARYRQILIDVPGVRAEWEELGDEDELEDRYRQSRGGWAATLDLWLNDPQRYVEVFRNGDWRAASYREVPLAQRTRELGLDRLVGQAEDLRNRAAVRLEARRVAVGPAEEAVKAAKAALEAAQAAVVDAEKGAEAAEKTAREIDADRVALAEELDAMLRRQDGAGAETATAVNV